jgi:two-component system LytT family sensor kinase
LADYPRNDSSMRACSLHRIGSSLQLSDDWPGERTIIAAMPTEPIGSKAAWWIWNLSIWVGIGLFDATQNVVVMHSEGMHHAWVALFFVLLVSRLPWALFTPVILRLARRYPPTQFTRPITLGPHVIADLIMGLVVAAWVAGWEKLLNPWAYSSDAGPLLDLWKGRFYNGLLETFFLYSAVLAAYLIIESRNRLLREAAEKAELNEQLAKAQLSALRRQIEPHFLFNTLNSIAAQVREGKNDSAVSMIAALSDVLRSLMTGSSRPEVPLAEEVQLLRKYLEIQKARFAERLQVKLDIPNELLTALVPGLLLQLIVENAIRHGIAKRAFGGAVKITAARLNGSVTFNVYNDGPPLPANWESSSPGIGLSNLHQRLRSLYGEGYKFTIQNRHNSGVEVSISVPFREA